MTTVLTAFVAGAVAMGGQGVHPMEMIGPFLIGWLLVPGAIGLVGALPLLLRRHP